MKNKFRNNIVFICSVTLTLVVVLWSIIQSNSFSEAISFAMSFLMGKFSGVYLGIELFFVVFCVLVAISPWGKKVLGQKDDQPAYSLASWFAMLFSAGMGVGMVFWGVAEPISHYVTPMAGITPESEESAKFALRSCMMHWGLHPWACYAVMGLAFSIFIFRKKEKAIVSSLFHPFFNNRNPRLFNTIIDTYTVVLTVFGIASSLGMGCLQICSGLEELFSIPNNSRTWLIMILMVTCIFLVSAISGIDKGVKILSNGNLILMIVLMIFAFVIGNCKDTVTFFLTGVHDYLSNFFQDSLRLSSNGDPSWIQNWRVYYWAWWVSWAPFVGVFIARISKGRTIRQFIVGVLFVPTIVSCLWFSIFSSLSFHVVKCFTTEELLSMAATPQKALFHVFSIYPFGTVLSVIAIILLIVFFITSADSATFVLAMLTSDGNGNPHHRKKIVWGVLIAIMAYSLILSGTISIIQTTAIVVGFPYIILLLVLCFSVAKVFRQENRHIIDGKHEN